ncbi:MAG: type I-D CRISPR-associated helicase Cas3' [Ardenticatenaceae bacterium]|nr:type I-D CRISPR-associated helicase Cas3' [Ardenticatenaceae bacterium]
MITLTLTSQNEKLAPENPWKLVQRPLYHQYRTAVALENPNTHLVVNSYNTGTGKTRASFLHLHELDGQRQDVLLVAPTNALLGQHAEDAREFVAEQGLDFKVIPITAAEIQKHREKIVAQGNYSEQQMRKGEILFRLLRNYREFYLGEYRRQGLIFVVNPDIFYYALMFQYTTHDQRNLFQSFLTHFRYIIVDEFHYYDQKQLAFFLFFFAISKQMGYFEHAGRKICLLSATPNSHVIDYLNQLFGDNWQHVSPENEPSESADYETTPTLSPLTLKIDSQKLLEWFGGNGRFLQTAIQQKQQHGAVISDSLRRINRLFAALLPQLGQSSLGRITGPEPEDARQTATGKPLILATPTVDIGYNFKKIGKQRQNIDFLICEARYGDDLIQRLGRAGRILGKPEQDQLSEAVALLPETAVDAFHPYNGQTLTRAQFKAIILQNQDKLPQKHNLTGYIESWAITEVFYPIYRADKQFVLQKEHEAVQELYQQLCQLFGVRGKSFQSLSTYFRKFYYRQQWLKATKNSVPLNKQTAEQVADWFKFRQESDIGEPSATDILPFLDHESILAHLEQKAALRQFVTSQVDLTQSLFNFRDSFQGPTAVIYDPNHLLSSETINQHDLFHILESYDVQWFADHREFNRLCPSTELTGDFYGRIRAHRDPILYLELTYRTNETQDDFQRLWEGRPVALSGFHLQGRESGGDLFPIEQRFVTAVAEKYLTVLLIAPDMKGWAIRQLQHSPIYGRKLIIDFQDRDAVEYTSYVGKAAWLAYPELRTAFKIRERMKSEAIII